MRKTILIIFVLLANNFVSAQDFKQQNLQKYWNYRQRINDGFVIVGDCAGCSLPAGVRKNIYESTTDATSYTFKLGYDDETINLGYYIAMLATEVGLLQKNNQDASESIKELYYALMAFNRLDATAEPYWSLYYPMSTQPTGIEAQTATTNLNGFFIRDDVKNDFLLQSTNGVQHLTKLNSGYFSSPSTRLALSTYHYTWDEEYNYVHNGIESGFVEQVENEVDKAHSSLHWHHNMRLGPREVSQDQVWPIFMGLALTTHYVDPTTVFNGKNLVTEAKDICNRIMNHLKSNGYQFHNNVTGECPKGVFWENNNFSDCNAGGATVLQYAYGAAKVAEFIFNGDTSYPNYVNDFGPGTIGNLSWEFIENNYFLGTGIFNAEKNKILLIAALGNSFDLNEIPLGATYKTSTILHKVGFDSESSVFEFPYLLHQVLYNSDFLGMPDLEDYWRNILNAAPCASLGGQSSSTPAGFNYNLIGGHTIASGFGKAATIAEFWNGINYMLLYNLYYLNFKDKISLPAYTKNVTVTESNDFTISDNFPIPLNPAFGMYLGDFTRPYGSAIATNLNVNGSHFASNSKAKFFATTSISTINVEIEPGAEVDFVILDCSSQFDPITVFKRGTVEEEQFFENIEIENNLKDTLEIHKKEKRLINEGSIVENKMELDENKIKLAIYPNPNNGEFVLEISNAPKGNYTLQITDAVGRSVIQQNYVIKEQNLKQNINLQAQGKGIYFVKINSEQINEVRKIVVE